MNHVPLQSMTKFPNYSLLFSPIEQHEPIKNLLNRNHERKKESAIALRTSFGWLHIHPSPEINSQCNNFLSLKTLPPPQSQNCNPSGLSSFREGYNYHVVEHLVCFLLTPLMEPTFNFSRDIDYLFVYFVENIEIKLKWRKCQWVYIYTNQFQWDIREIINILELILKKKKLMGADAPHFPSLIWSSASA